MDQSSQTAVPVTAQGSGEGEGGGWRQEEAVSEGLEGKFASGFLGQDGTVVNPATSPEERLQRIRATIEAARPMLQRDGGDMELVAVEGEFVRVRLSGACVSCTLAGQTLGGVRRRLMASLGEAVRVVPVPVE